MNLLLTLYIHLCFIVYDERIRKSQQTQNWWVSSERLWLAIAFQSSTELCVIG